MTVFLVILAALAALILITSAVCFFIVFYSPKRTGTDDSPIPEGEVYVPFREQMAAWIKAADEMPYKRVSIRSFDGLTLRGRYFEYSKDAPIELLMHGYRGTSRRDLSGGVARCFALGHSALIVDHRASGESDGRVITFGAKESHDCERWVNFILRNIDPDAKIILTGISMGAATVLITSARELPKNVIGVLADCGYTSSREIIKKVLRDMKLPQIFYPLIRLGGILFGHFDTNRASPIDAMKKCRLPVIFFHGDTDDFVPCEMSTANYEACISENKRLVITTGAGHGLCFPVDRDTYIAALREFFDPLV